MMLSDGACPQLHPLCQQKPIVEYCKKNDIVVEAYTPLIRGKFDNPVFKAIAEKACFLLLPVQNEC
jgi:diketogulonate reductase-like aldo/keto reductase